MQTLLDIIVPIFGLIAVGYAFARLELLSEATGEALAKFVFVVSVPLLLFRTLATSHFGDANPLILWSVYFGAVAVVWTVATLLMRFLAGANRRAGVIAGISAGFANTVFVAIPMVQRAYGDAGLEPLLLIVAVHVPTMMTASILLMERAAALDARDAGARSPAATRTGTAVRILRNLATNGIVIGILAGLAFRATGLRLPGPVDEITRHLAGTAAPLALFSLGMSLTRYGIRGDLLSSAVVSVLSLLIMPAIVFAAGSEVLPPLWLKAAVLTAACPVGVNAYIFAAYFKSGEKLAATTILVSTVASVATVSLWLTVLG